MEAYRKSGSEFNRPYEISAEQLDSILNEGYIIREQDTLISGLIRLIEVNNRFMVQETSTKNELIIRLFATEAEALHFLSDRLDVYENMWNGCGCKVDYYK